MNPLIKKFAEQADEYAHNATGSPENRTNGKSYNQNYEEKFAELIVRECAVYCEGHILPKGMAEENDLNYNDGVGDCAIGLKQHFGVKA